MKSAADILKNNEKGSDDATQKAGPWRQTSIKKAAVAVSSMISSLTKSESIPIIEKANTTRQDSIKKAEEEVQLAEQAEAQYHRVQHEDMSRMREVIQHYGNAVQHYYLAGEKEKAQEVAIRAANTNIRLLAEGADNTRKGELLILSVALPYLALIDHGFDIGEEVIPTPEQWAFLNEVRRKRFTPREVQLLQEDAGIQNSEGLEKAWKRISRHEYGMNPRSLGGFYQHNDYESLDLVKRLFVEWSKEANKKADLQQAPGVPLLFSQWPTVATSLSSAEAEAAALLLTQLSKTLPAAADSTVEQLSHHNTQPSSPSRPLSPTGSDSSLTSTSDSSWSLSSSPASSPAVIRQQPAGSGDDHSSRSERSSVLPRRARWELSERAKKLLKPSPLVGRREENAAQASQHAKKAGDVRSALALG